MSIPQNAEDLFQLIRKSGLIDEPKLGAFIKAHQRDGLLREEPKKVVAALAREGVLTYFQGEQFLQGKWRGFTLGKYKLLERVGVGGMGQIFLCEHTFMRRRVAIKVLPPSKAEDPVSLGRFYREARVAAGLDHPNIVRTFDIDQDANLHFLVMEYVDGISLLEIVKKFGPLAVDRACHYIRQACQGLQYAHSVGMIHRDIKPGNIIVDRGGTAKLLDMGLARLHQDEADQLTIKYDDRNVLGTADYVAPEQTRDSRNIDIRADIYGMGATFFYVLTGQPPFPEGTLAEKLIAHQTRKPRSVRELRPDVPAGVAKIIERMLAKDPKDRYQTPQEVVEALEGWTQQPIAPPSEAELPKLSPAAMDPAYGAGTSQLAAPSHPRDAGSVRPDETVPSRPAAAPARPRSEPTPAAASAKATPQRPSGSVIDLVAPPAPRAAQPTPAPRSAANETEPLAAAGPTPQPPAKAPPAEAPRLPGSHPGLPGSRPAPLPGSHLGRLPGSHLGRSSVLPPLRPSAQGTAKPAQPAPSADQSAGDASEKRAAPPAPAAAHAPIELPKLRSFQGVAMSYTSAAPAGTAPEAGRPAAEPPRIQAPAAPEATCPAPPPAPRMPSSAPAAPRIAPPAAAEAPRIQAPAAPPPTAQVPLPPSGSPLLHSSALGNGLLSARPAYTPPAHMPFFDQPIMPEQASFGVRLTRWVLLVAISTMIGATLGVGIWYQFFRLAVE